MLKKSKSNPMHKSKLIKILKSLTKEEFIQFRKLLDGITAATSMYMYVYYRMSVCVLVLLKCNPAVGDELFTYRNLQ